MVFYVWWEHGTFAFSMLLEFLCYLNISKTGFIPIIEKHKAFQFWKIKSHSLTFITHQYSNYNHMLPKRAKRMKP